MLRRPPIRAVLATAASAALLVGGINLASYATTHHGNGGGAGASTAPKVLKFHLGVQNQAYNGGALRLYTAKVPKGNYSVSMSGILDDEALDASGDSYSCLLADKKDLVRLLGSTGSSPSFKRIYAVAGQDFNTTGSFDFGVFDTTNPVAHVDRTKIVFGCAFNGVGPYRIARVPVFTLTPIKVDSRSGKRFIPAIPKSDLQRLSRALR